MNLYYTILSIYLNFINNFSSRHQGSGADTLKFNLHIIGRVKKGCEYNQKRCELKKFRNKITGFFIFKWMQQAEFFILKKINYAFQGISSKA
jgi:hypothetical protein